MTAPAARNAAEVSASLPVAPPGPVPVLPPLLVAEGARLLHQQCWLWGQDLRSPGGNLLAAFGGRRIVLGSERANEAGNEPDNEPGGPGAGAHHVAYGFRLPAGVLVAWSGGVACGDSAGAVLLPRLRFAPIALDGGALDGGMDLDAAPGLNPLLRLPPAAATPEVLARLAAACAWIAGYETWVAARRPGWRDRCIEAWDHIEREAARLARGEGVAYERVAAVPASALGAAWRGLATAIEALP